MRANQKIKAEIWCERKTCSDPVIRLEGVPTPCRINGPRDFADLRLAVMNCIICKHFRMREIKNEKKDCKGH